jgi:hypothetical protein
MSSYRLIRSGNDIQIRTHHLIVVDKTVKIIKLCGAAIGVNYTVMTELPLSWKEIIKKTLSSLITLFYVLGPVHRESISITVQQDAI